MKVQTMKETEKKKAIKEAKQKMGWQERLKHTVHKQMNTIPQKNWVLKCAILMMHSFHRQADEAGNMIAVRLTVQCFPSNGFLNHVSSF